MKESVAYVQVYLGELFASTQVAVKVLKTSDARSQEAFLNEMSILKSLHHGNIVQFLGACLLRKTVALVTEFMPQGDLWHALSSDPTKELGWYMRWGWSSFFSTRPFLLYVFFLFFTIWRWQVFAFSTGTVAWYSSTVMKLVNDNMKKRHCLMDIAQYRPQCLLPSIYMAILDLLSYNVCGCSKIDHVNLSNCYLSMLSNNRTVVQHKVWQRQCYCREAIWES